MSAAVETLYRVSAGDSLSKIAQKFYGDANRYTEIARFNNLNPQAVLYIGQPLRLPAEPQDALEEVQITAQRLPTTTGTVPGSPGGSIIDPLTGIETVTTTAYVWWKDWRWYAGIGAVGVALWYLSGKRR